MNPIDYDALANAISTSGPAAAAATLCDTLRAQGDYAKLFYALLVQKRIELGVSPLPTTSAGDFTPEQQAAYEDTIRDSCRTVGNLFLSIGDLPSAFSYFSMIGEREPIRAALEAYAPGPDDDVQPAIEVALHHGVFPEKGFDLVLERYGICSAITTASQIAGQLSPEARRHCIRQLLCSLHAQLRERLRYEVQQREEVPADASITDLLKGRDWLFDDDAYHIDTSHLSSVVQMSIELETAGDLAMARELCAYGQKLAPGLQYPGTTPFDNLYADVDVYLRILSGEEVEAGLAHFREKITADPDGPEPFAAEVLVKLLVRLGRSPEALAVAAEFLYAADDRELSCPGVLELSQRLGEYRVLAEVAKRRGDPVHFLAARIAETQKASGS